MSEQTPARPPSLRRTARLWRVLAWAGSGLLVVAVTAGITLAGTVAPLPGERPVPAWQVDVPPSATSLVCPGPVRLPTEPEPGEDVSYDPEFDPEPGESSATLRALVAAPLDEDGSEAGDRPGAGSLLPLGEDGAAALADLTPAGGVATAVLDQLERGVVVRADPSGDEPAWAGGAVGVTTLDGDLRGLAAASCQRPAAETWLVGGGTELASSARLVLQNPGRTPATVRVDLWGPAGPVELAGAPEYLVPAGAERVVLLEGVAAEQRRVVVRLASAGGLVTGYLQDSRLRGLVPAGLDYVVGGAAPAVRQVVAGVSVRASQADGADPALLRLLAPGDTGTTAQVTLVGPDGEVTLPGTDAVELEPGSVLDVPLAGLPAGDYAAVVEATEPVVAGAMITRGAEVGLPETEVLGEAPLERAWASAGSGGSGVLAVPQGAQGRLLLGFVPQDGVGPASAQVRIQVVGADGSVLGERELRLPVGRTTSLPLDDLLEDGASGTQNSAGVLLHATHDDVAWAAVLERAGEGEGVEAGGLVSVVIPVAPEADRPQVGVRVR